MAENKNPSEKPKKPRKGVGDYPSSTGKVVNVKADQGNWRKKMQRSRIKFDDDQKERYLTALRATGLKGSAAQAAGVSKQCVMNHRENDPEFVEAADEALEAYRDIVAAEVKRRGVDGWLEPVFHRGQRVMEVVLGDDGKPILDREGNMLLKPSSILKFSDRLVELEAKRVDPSYRDKATIDLSGGVSGVLVAPAGMTPEEAVAEGEAANEVARVQRETEAKE